MHRLFLAPFAILCLLSLLFVPSVFAEKTLERVEPEFVWEIGTIVPGHMGWSKRAKELLIPLVDESTEGRVDVKVYWGGIKGYEDELIDKMNSGELAGTALSGAGTTIICPEFAVLSLPYLFNGYDEVDHVRAKMWPVFESYMKKRGYQLILWIDQDFDQIYSAKHDPSTLARLRRAKFAQWCGPVEKHVFTALGLDPIPIQVFDMPGMLREEDFDAAVGPALWVLGMQVYPTIKYMIRDNIRYSPVTVEVTNKVWEALPEEFRHMTLGKRDKVVEQFVELAREDSERCIKAMKAYGLREVEMPPGEARKVREIAKSSWRIMAGDLFPRELLDELLAHLEEYRSSR
ncbi:MAG: TRAP transporter substrate-binding protein DctP [Desulfatibacillaceae bacterium]